MRLQTLTPLLLTLTLPIAWVAGQDGYGLARVSSSKQDAKEDDANVAVGATERADERSTMREVIAKNEQEKAELQRQIEELSRKAAQLAERSNAAMPEMRDADNQRAVREIKAMEGRRLFGTAESSDFPRAAVPRVSGMRDGRIPVQESRMIEEVTRDGKTIYRPQVTTYYRDTKQSQEDQQAFELAQKYRSTKDEAEKQKLRKQLEEITTLAFKKQLEERGAQVDEAQAKLDGIKARLEQRKELSGKIIERRIADLLDDPDPYAWEFEAAQTFGEPLKFFRNVPGTNIGVPFVPDAYLPRRPSAPAAPAAPAPALPPASK